MRTTIRYVLISLTLLPVGFTVTLLLWLVFWVKVFDLPNFDAFFNYRPQQTAYFLSRNGKVIGCVAPASGWKDTLPSEPDIGKTLLAARVILFVEDKRFYERDLAIDVRGLGRAAWEDLKAGEIVEGGSTIPQQLVKQLLPPEERRKKSITRKIKEFVLAWRLVRKFSKDEILALYLNEIYLGHQRYGIEAASRYYYNKSARALTLSDAATLAGIIKSPEKLSPKNYPDRAKNARDEVLEKLYLAGTIPTDEYETSLKEPLETTSGFETECSSAPHAVDYVRAEVRRSYGLFLDERGSNPAWFGLRVETTLDEKLQELANQGVKTIITEYEARQGENAIDAEGAVVAVENETGAIVAMVGGKDYSRRKYNHAASGRRQVGSAFKPFDYLAKFEAELASGEIQPEQILNRPVSNAKIRCPKVWRADPNNPAEWWEPKNFEDGTEKYNAKLYSRRIALAKSINLPAVHIAQIDKCRLNPRVLEMAKRFGLTEPIEPYLSSALGASSHSLLTMVRAYSILPNLGVLHPPHIVTKVYDAGGNTYFEKSEWDAGKKRVISDPLAEIMTEALRGAVKFGTASGMNTLAQPVACKTGTTQDYTDALLFCFSPGLTVGGWMGGPEDYSKKLGYREYGARLVPGIKYVLERWYQNTEPQPFPNEFPEWKNYEKDPKLFEKEMKELERPETPDQVQP